jgi:hypothetical protein
MNRKVNLDAMSEENFESLLSTTSRRVNARLTAAQTEVNEMLSRYGLEVELSFEIRSTVDSTKTEG